CALNSSPSRGTLPCTAATVIAGSSPAPTPDCRTCGHANAVVSSTTLIHTPGSTTAGGAADRLSWLWRNHFTISRVIAAKLNPVKATANDSNGAPPSCAIPSNGPLV